MLIPAGNLNPSTLHKEPSLIRGPSTAHKGSSLMAGGGAVYLNSLTQTAICNHYNAKHHMWYINACRKLHWVGQLAPVAPIVHLSIATKSIIDYDYNYDYYYHNHYYYYNYRLQLAPVAPIVHLSIATIEGNLCRMPVLTGCL